MLFSLAILAIQLVLLYAVSGYLRRVIGRLGRVSLAVMAPGVVVHEMSHFVACLLTRTPVKRVRFFAPHYESPRTLVLGYVEHLEPGDPFSAFLIGAAPFFGGAAALWALLALAYPQILTSVSASAADGGLATLIGAARREGELALALFRAFDFTGAKTWVFLFLLTSISSHVAPSDPDMKYALAGLGTVALVLALPILLVGRYLPETAEVFAGRLEAGSRAVSALLGYGLSCAAFIAAALGFLEAGYEGMKRMRIRWRA